MHKLCFLIDYNLFPIFIDTILVVLSHLCHFGSYHPYLYNLHNAKVFLLNMKFICTSYLICYGQPDAHLANFVQLNISIRKYHFHINQDN